jgi:hypothetical protein
MAARQAAGDRLGFQVGGEREEPHESNLPGGGGREQRGGAKPHIAGAGESRSRPGKGSDAAEPGVCCERLREKGARSCACAREG